MVAAFGCKVSRIEARAEAAALDATALGRRVILVRTCTVTERGDRDVKRTIRRLRRQKPDAWLVASGCLAERDPESLARMPEVDLVVGFARAGEVARLLSDREAGLLPGKVAPARTPERGDPAGEAVFFPDPGRTRAFLKIQDGCERRCAFCIVPSLRGPERSVDPVALENEIRRVGASGVPEVVLAGVHLANFGKDRGTSLLSLLRRLDAEPPPCRVRLSSLEPMEAGAELVDLVATSRAVVPHLHLPLQSGCDAVLRRMRRGITASRYRALALRATRANPRLHLATDLIAGFPGENPAEFAETERFVAELPLASLHVFPFSPRSGTRGAGLHGEHPVASADVTRRAARLRRLGEEKARVFRRSADGTLADAVVLRGGMVLTDHYLEAALETPCPPGSRLFVRLSASGPAARLTAVPAPEAGRIPPP